MYDDRLLQASKHRFRYPCITHYTVPGTQLVFSKTTYDDVLTYDILLTESHREGPTPPPPPPHTH